MSDLVRLLVATRNRGKLREYQELLAGLPVELTYLGGEGIVEDVEETGSSFAENAVLKAQRYALISGLVTLADDSGLEVDALGGEPGVHSARYAGPGASDEDRYRLLLEKMQHVPPDERGARFRCVIAVAEPRGGTYTADGVCDGEIAFGPEGDFGFGYDPVFLPRGRGRTMAQLPPEEKNRISHRARAAQAMRPVLERLVGRDHVSGEG
jgi:XTP/dITP diphosphohydrolase